MLGLFYLNVWKLIIDWKQNIKIAWSRSQLFWFWEVGNSSQIKDQTVEEKAFRELQCSEWRRRCCFAWMWCWKQWLTEIPVVKAAEQHGQSAKASGRAASQGYLILCSIFVTISVECGDGDQRWQEEAGGIMVRKRVHFFGTIGLNSKENTTGIWKLSKNQFVNLWLKPDVAKCDWGLTQEMEKSKRRGCKTPSSLVGEGKTGKIRIEKSFVQHWLEQDRRVG